jgi:xanthine dehydrogenase small subunit
MHTRPIRFYAQGRLHTLPEAVPTRTVLQHLREDLHCTGTKEGCAEGDCGACTVVIGELADLSAPPAPGVSRVGALDLRNVNACIQFLPTLDGKALFTVEDLKRLAGGRLHPVQQALVECHGSQCGFCTPGFVMSLWHTYERHGCGAASRPSRQQLADDLSGNLCRCTGYRPILDAGERMFDLPAVSFDTAPIEQALRSLASEQGAQLASPAGAARFFAPRTVAELADLRLAHPRARLLAGSTDVGLWVTKQLRDLGDLIYLGEVAELRHIELRDGLLHIGAGATLEAAWSALVAQYPNLSELWLRFASPPIRHAGTMGGNVANGSPIGDSAPALIALDAQIVLRRGERVRRLMLADFYLDYMKNALEPGEFVQSLEVPLPQAGQVVRGYKISKRYDSDISAVCLGLSLWLDGDTVRDVRLAYGGMAATVRRAPRAEAALRGQLWSHERVQAAMEALSQDFQPLTDMRATAEYRLKVARNLILRAWHETRPGATPVVVWHDMPHALPAPAEV